MAKEVGNFRESLHWALKRILSTSSINGLNSVKYTVLGQILPIKSGMGRHPSHLK